MAIQDFCGIVQHVKNSSERENDDAFRQFHNLVHELATGSLLNIQFICIDKECCEPDARMLLVGVDSY